jgi:hypothetical protein
MLLPVGAWGTQFTAIPLMFLTTNTYQVVANTDNTLISAGNTVIARLNRGQYHKFATPATLITANNPIQLIQLGQVIIFPCGLGHVISCTQRKILSEERKTAQSRPSTVAAFFNRVHL